MSQVTRRDFLTHLTAGAAALAATQSAAATAPSGGKPARRPNILIFHSHDLGQFLHCYGVRTVSTPNYDLFAAEGLRFVRAYCTQPGCSPARASLFTGRYPHCNGVMGLTHGEFAWDLHPGERHLAQVLREAGYATAAVGVIHETSSGSERCGYESFDKPSRVAGAVNAAIARLKKMQQSGKPFFLCVGTVEPHRLPYPQPVAPTGLPGDSLFPGPHLKPDDSLGVDVPPWLHDTPGTRSELAGLQGAVRHVDEQLGRLLAAVKELGLYDNTLVVVTTDHGIAMPRAKCSVYEPGVLVALMMRFPGRPGWSGGAAREELVSTMDVFPTILDFVGLPIPANVQGRSLAPLLDGKAFEPRRELFTELTYHDYYDPRRAIRTETHKLIVNFTTAPAFMDPSQTWRPLSEPVTPPNHAMAYHPPVELFDLKNDPWEQKDLANDPKLAEVKRDLLRSLHEHMVATGDPILQGAVTSPHHLKAAALLSGTDVKAG